jgi:hypothetical protein
MQLGTEDKKVSMQRAVKILVIFFVLLGIALIVLHFEDVKQMIAEMDLIQKPEASQGSANQITTTIPQMSESQISQIKMDIVTGKREDVPAEVAADKDLVVSEYLYNCYMVTDADERTVCYEIYYLSNDAEYRQRKEACEALNAVEKSRCLDAFYYDKSSYNGYDLCYAIKDTALQENCTSNVR